MANPFCHIELHSKDIEKSKAFYSALFDWKLEDVPMDGITYTMINVGEGTGGGMMVDQGPKDVPSRWLPYILVDDIHASAKKAEELGATFIESVQEIPGYGSFCIMRDTAGAVIAMWQEAKKQ